MAVDVAVKVPHTWVIGNHPQGSPSQRPESGSVPQQGIFHVVIGRVCFRIKNSISTAHNPERMTVGMPGVEFRGATQTACILEDNFKYITDSRTVLITIFYTFSVNSF